MRDYSHFVVQFLGSLGEHFGFVLPNIAWPKEHAAREVRVFNGVHIANFNMANSDQDQVLYDLIAQGSGSNYQDLGVRQCRLIPPCD